jgi:hypothetical protein
MYTFTFQYTFLYTIFTRELNKGKGFLNSTVGNSLTTAMTSWTEYKYFPSVRVRILKLVIIKGKKNTES